MSFFKKTFQSILGHSNSEDQPDSGSRSPPSPGAGGLALISTTSSFESPGTVLESVAVRATPFVLGGGDEISMPADGIRHSTARAFRPVDSAEDIRIGLDRFTTLTESIGCESSDLMVTEDLPSPIMAGTRRREIMRREKMMEGKFPPPMLSTLKENGRPKFNLRKVRKDGRLQISSVPNDSPDVVRTIFPEEDRLKIRFVSSDQEEGGSSSEEREKEQEIGRDNASDQSGEKEESENEEEIGRENATDQSGEKEEREEEQEIGRENATDQSGKIEERENEQETGGGNAGDQSGENEEREKEREGE